MTFLSFDFLKFKLGMMTVPISWEKPLGKRFMASLPLSRHSWEQ